MTLENVSSIGDALNIYQNQIWLRNMLRTLKCLILGVHGPWDLMLSEQDFFQLLRNCKKLLTIWSILTYYRESRVKFQKLIEQTLINAQVSNTKYHRLFPQYKVFNEMNNTT